MALRLPWTGRGRKKMGSSASTCYSRRPCYKLRTVYLQTSPQGEMTSWFGSSSYVYYVMSDDWLIDQLNDWLFDSFIDSFICFVVVAAAGFFFQAGIIRNDDKPYGCLELAEDAKRWELAWRARGEGEFRVLCEKTWLQVEDCIYIYIYIYMYIYTQTGH